MRTGDPGITRKVIVGEVVKPVGLKGELKVKPMTDNPDRFVEGGRVWVEVNGGDERAFVIARVSPEHRGTLKLMLDGWTPKTAYQFINAGIVIVTRDNIDTYAAEVRKITDGIAAELQSRYFQPPR